MAFLPATIVKLGGLKSWADNEHSKGFVSMFGSFSIIAMADEFAEWIIAEFQQVNPPPSV